MIVRDRVAAALEGALKRYGEQADVHVDALPAVRLDMPPTPDLGDFCTDAAMIVGRQSGLAAPEVARALAGYVTEGESLIERADVGASGVLNIRLRADWIVEGAQEARRLGPEFGKSPDLGGGARLHLEFVSANPTGPLGISHGRGAALGCALGNLLEWSGFNVTREFYVNDVGDHLGQFGVSLEAVLENHRRTLDAFGVRFDEWFSESALQESGAVDEAIRLLRESGSAYESEGALWLRATGFGDSEDRPLLRSNGQPTYLAGDLAYHLDKFGRGFERAIDIWGPEHAGYVQRTQAGIRALGIDPSALEILVFAPVTVRVDGVRLEAGASTGNNVELAEVIEGVGPHGSRFLYLSRPLGTPLELDLDLSRDQSGRSAFARIRAAQTRLDDVLSEARARGDLPGPDIELRATGEPEAMALMREIASFPDEVRAAAREREPHRIVRYLMRITEMIERFQHGGGAGRGPERLALADAAGVAVRNALKALGME